MTSLPKTYITPEDYLAFDRKAEVKSEYYAGRVIAFAGASKSHNLIVANVLAGIHRQLMNRPCNVYPSDLRVRISKTGMYAYPDVVVTCGEEQFADDNNDILLNPIVLVEVLSESTASYDRGDKFEHYRRIESLREYVIVAQEPYRVDQYVRQNDTQWLLTEFHAAEGIVQLRSINCELALKEIYAKI
ncbi:MAG TPA: Uma2 family endonuclease [Blastocatellia bacterium]|jgi:Uma2 family endonuclease|nr:Uma2 family endonuclease [Blastocatellia bacterium]